MYQRRWLSRGCSQDPDAVRYLSNNSSYSYYLANCLKIPYVGSTAASSQARAKQAKSDIPKLTLNEVNSLGLLTKAGCSSTPRLFAWKHKKQGMGAWGIYGLHPDGENARSYATSVSVEERAQLLEGFKNAFMWVAKWNCTFALVTGCAACGAVHADPGLQNILWGRERQKWLYHPS